MLVFGSSYGLAQILHTLVRYPVLLDGFPSNKIYSYTQPELEGIITLEDVIEELIGEEIIDETDLYVDVHQRIAVARARLQYQRQSISDPEQLRGAAAKTKRKKARRSHSYAQGMNEHARPVRSASELFEVSYTAVLVGWLAQL